MSIAINRKVNELQSLLFAAVVVVMKINNDTNTVSHMVAGIDTIKSTVAWFDSWPVWTFPLRNLLVKWNRVCKLLEGMSCLSVLAVQWTNAMSGAFPCFVCWERN